MAFEHMPGYDLINVVKDLDPVSAVRDQEAAERMSAYPKLVGTGSTDFGYAEQSGTEWRILTLGCMDPESARIGLASHLRKTAADEQDCVAREKMLTVAGRLDPEEGEPSAANEWVVAGRRYRVIRVQGFVRLGVGGPEPPRATDTDPAGDDPPSSGFLLAPAAMNSPSEAVLRMEMLNMLPAPGTASEAVRQEASDALLSHPGVVLLPPDYTIVEDEEGGWRPLTGGHGPGDARRSLAFYFREIAPRIVPPGTPPPTPEQRAEYTRAAERLRTATGHEFAVCGRVFRTIRVVHMVRVGPDGPEMARPSDEDILKDAF